MKAVFFGVAAMAGFPLFASASTEPLLVRNRQELFTDDAIVESLSGMERRLGVPVSAGKALVFDQPWEGQFSMAGTVVRTPQGYRMLYRGLEKTGGVDETICYAESDDGIRWRRPDLGRVKRPGWEGNNALARSAGPADAVRYNALGSFTVLYDDRPEVPERERYKSVSPIGEGRGHGLSIIVSPNGLDWEPLTPGPETKPIAPGYALDTANVLTWLPAEKCYAIYMRGWTGDTPGVTPDEPNELGRISPFFHGIRTIMRSVSRDLVHWSPPERMTFGDTPMEHLYTIAAQPYFRAPHLVLSFPMRFDPERAHNVLTDEQLAAAGIHEKMWKGVSDAVFMTSRGGNAFDRLFLDSFVRPGSDPRNWGARSQIVAVGVVPTGPTEISFYVNRAYGTPQAYVERMILRPDGFVSLHAGRKGGYAITRPLRLEGTSLRVNFASSPFGFVKVLVLDEAGRELPGFGDEDTPPIKGDDIDRVVRWAGDRSIEDFRGRAVRLKFVAQDADIYSFGVFAKGPVP